MGLGRQATKLADAAPNPNMGPWAGTSLLNARHRGPALWQQAMLGTKAPKCHQAF